MTDARFPITVTKTADIHSRGAGFTMDRDEAIRFVSRYEHDNSPRSRQMVSLLPDRLLLEELAHDGRTEYWQGITDCQGNPVDFAAMRDAEV